MVDGRVDVDDDDKWMRGSISVMDRGKGKPVQGFFGGEGMSLMGI